MSTVGVVFYRIALAGPAVFGSNRLRHISRGFVLPPVNHLVVDSVDQFVVHMGVTGCCFAIRVARCLLCSFQVSTSKVEKSYKVMTKIVNVDLRWIVR